MTKRTKPPVKPNLQYDSNICYLKRTQQGAILLVLLTAAGCGWDGFTFSWHHLRLIYRKYKTLLCSSPLQITVMSANWLNKISIFLLWTVSTLFILLRFLIESVWNSWYIICIYKQYIWRCINYADCIWCQITLMTKMLQPWNKDNVQRFVSFLCLHLWFISTITHHV